MSIVLAALGFVWLLPLTVLGSLVALVTWSPPVARRGTTVVCRAGRIAVWIMTGPVGALFTGGSSIAAFTWGDVVLVQPMYLEDERLLRHELAHVRQGHQWGPLFPLAYAAAGIWAAISWRDWRAWYVANPFEVAARRAAAA